MTEQKKRLLQAKIAAAHYTENLHMGVNFAPLCNLAQRLTQKARDTFGSQQAAIFGSSRGESGAGFPEFGDLDLYG